MSMKWIKSAEHERILVLLRQKQALLGGNVATAQKALAHAEVEYEKINAQVLAAEDEAEAIRIRDVMFPPEAQARTREVIRRQITAPNLGPPVSAE